ncbi:MAG: pyrroline-5-carboxylate reductase [Proteobacteria bacterium]|nr:pyrroline-5-carboxylate reductase [Pseudomonadota bacterium]
MKILLVGCGRMGGAMVKGWLASLPSLVRIDVIEPQDVHLPSDPRLSFFKDGPSWSAQKREIDVVVLAVKPQMMTEVNTALAPLVSPHVPVLSIAAGITLTNLTKAWGEMRPIIRAMPNTPGAIGRGVTVYVTNTNINENHKVIINSLLVVLGTVYQAIEEPMMDAVTAVSGSGPAYLYNFVEALEEAGKSVGLPPALACALARETVTGAAALMDHEKDQSPKALREAVTSPGGTTEAGLYMLMGNQVLEDIMKMAVKAAWVRSKNLAQPQ